MPPLQEGNLWIRATLPQDISFERAATLADQLRADLSTFPEVTQVEILSRTMIDASTRMPKSIAPIEIRLAECPVRAIIENANSTANGIVAAAIRVVRRSPSITSRISVTRKKPVRMTCLTV